MLFVTNSTRKAIEITLGFTFCYSNHITHAINYDYYYYYYNYCYYCLFIYLLFCLFIYLFIYLFCYHYIAVLSENHQTIPQVANTNHHFTGNSRRSRLIALYQPLPKPHPLPLTSQVPPYGRAVLTSNSR